MTISRQPHLDSTLNCRNTRSLRERVMLSPCECRTPRDLSKNSQSRMSSVPDVLKDKNEEPMAISYSLESRTPSMYGRLRLHQTHAITTLRPPRSSFTVPYPLSPVLSCPVLVVDAGEKNPLMLTSHLIGKVTDVYFSSSGSGDDKVVGWYEEHGHDVRLAQDRSSERFLDV